MEKPRFLKSQKINRLSAHLQALWECDLSAAGGRRAVSKKVQGHAQPGISSLNTVSSSPDDHPDDHLGRSVQEMRRARGTQSRQETTPGARSVLNEAHPTEQGFGDTLQAGRCSDTSEGQ